MKLLVLTYLFLQVTFNSSAQLREGFVNIKDGKLYYQVKGTGTPLVFLHGICLDHRMWDKQVQYFSDSFMCINIDLRGFGKSSLPDSPYSFHEDILTLLDRLHIYTPVCIIALSMGGKAAVNFALAYPNRTKCLVLADVAVDGFRFKEFDLGPLHDIAKNYGVDSANRQFLKNAIFSSMTEEPAYTSLKEMVLSYSGWQWLHKNPATMLNPVAIEQLDRIQVPVLIITGDKDIQDFQDIANILHKNINQSVKMEIIGAGHMCNMENPRTFNQLVDDFLSNQK